MRLNPSIVGVDTLKIFRRVKLLVRRTAKDVGSPSPSTSKGYASTSSKNKYRTGIERNPTEEFAPVICKIPVPSANSFVCIVLPESRERGSLILSFKHGVSLIRGVKRPFDQRLPSSTVGNTTRAGPGLWSII